MRMTKLPGAGIWFVVSAIAAMFACSGGAIAQRTIEEQLGLLPNHYECYDVVQDKRVARVVRLQDQFKTDPKVIVGRPAFLCTPVRKNEERVTDERTHLVCYEIEGALPANKTVRVTNQFGSEILQVRNSHYLCVPSDKRVLQAGTMLTPQPPCLTSPPGPPGMRYGTRNLALGATLAPGVRQDVTLMVSTSGAPAQIQLGPNGPTTDAFEICVAIPAVAGARPVLLGANVSGVLEDPSPTPPGGAGSTYWDRPFRTSFVAPLANTPMTPVRGADVLKLDVQASDLQRELLNPKWPPGYPSGRMKFTLTLGGQPFILGVTLAPQ